MPSPGPHAGPAKTFQAKDSAEALAFMGDHLVDAGGVLLRLTLQEARRLQGDACCADPACNLQRGGDMLTTLADDLRGFAAALAAESLKLRQQVAHMPGCQGGRRALRDGCPRCHMKGALRDGARPH